MMRLLQLVVAIAFLLASGLAHGLWTDRWGKSEQLEAAARKLADVPLTLGDWDGRALEMSAREQEVAEVVGYAIRQFVNRRTGDVVTVLLVCGRPGPVAVHTPDVCYPGAGFALAGAPQRYRDSHPTTSPAEFFTASFTKHASTVPEHLRLFWSWSADGDWKVPDYPRWTFARYPALYKLYVVRQMRRADTPLEQDPCLEVLRLLLPELQKSLFANP
jgi:hypothetical protein